MICYKLGRYLADYKSYALVLDLSAYQNVSETSNRNLQLLNFPVNFDSFITSSAVLANILSHNSITCLSGSSYSDFVDPEIKRRAEAAIETAGPIIFCDLWGGLVMREVVDDYACRSGMLEHLILDRGQHFMAADFNFLRKIQAAVNPVAVHVRRGDFAAHDGGLLVGSEFYNDAMRQMEQKLELPEFFVFSDDIGWCKSNLHVAAPIHFADFNDELNAYRDLSLAASCRHLILSNESTFSHQIWELSDQRIRGLVVRSEFSMVEKNQKAEPCK